ncbi:hypothetical protein ACFQ2I_10030 [Paenibacillus chungangensis]|uniref:Uncharacterized protein n=1 Tax=Paenibacillus chungangensis TaxID=696535 RepID=A0ABW3HQA9_9BACL
MDDEETLRGNDQDSGHAAVHCRAGFAIGGYRGREASSGKLSRTQMG